MERLDCFGGVCDGFVEDAVKTGKAFEVFGAMGKGLGDLGFEGLIVIEFKAKA